MKKPKRISKILLLSFFMLCATCIQVPGATPPGIYKNISEYNEGTPSKSLTDDFYAKKKKYGLWGITSKTYVTFQRLMIDAKTARKMGKVFGFSDGEKLYVKTDGLRTFKISNFAEAEPIGKYLYYVDLDYYVDPRLPIFWSSYPVQKVIDKETGKRRYVTIHFIKKLIADKPELLQRFKNERRKNSYCLKQYLLAYYKS